MISGKECFESWQKSIFKIFTVDSLKCFKMLRNISYFPIKTGAIVIKEEKKNGRQAKICCAMLTLKSISQNCVSFHSAHSN